MRVWGGEGPAQVAGPAGSPAGEFLPPSLPRQAKPTGTHTASWVTTWAALGSYDLVRWLLVG